MTTDATAMAAAARAAQRRLGAAPGATRTAVLETLARLLEERAEDLVAANAEDLARADAEDLAAPLRSRLKLDAAKLATLVEGVRQLAAQPDPIGQPVRRTRLDDGLLLTQVRAPLGVLLVIFESRPDAAVQIGSLALRAGDAVLLKGGREASASNQALIGCLRDALAAHDLDPDAIRFVSGREEARALLAEDEHIDLVIPRGSGALVRSIQQTTRIPVLGHAEGVCHLYLDAAADPEMARRLVVDGKCDYPSACNATETLLVHRDFLGKLPAIGEALTEAGVELRACAEALPHLKGAKPATEDDWGTEYGDLVLAVKVVGDLDQAIEHIHRHGSSHTDAICTGDEETARAFLGRVDAASVFWNASTRFADGYRYGLGAEVGIATGRIHARGPVGVEGLLTTRWLLVGEGQTAADFSSGARRFAHEALPLRDEEGGTA